MPFFNLLSIIFSDNHTFYKLSFSVYLVVSSEMIRRFESLTRAVVSKLQTLRADTTTMKTIKKITGFVFITYMIIGCSTLSIDKIIDTSKRAMEQISQKALKKIFEEYYYEDEDENYRRVAKEDSEYRIERRLKTRRSILDSIGIDYKSLIIMDVLSHDVGGSYEETYYFYDENILRVVQSRKFETEFKPLILKVEKLEPIQDGDIIALYNHFNKKNHSEIEKTIDFNPEILRFGAFHITVVLNKKVKFYYANNVDLIHTKKIEIIQ